MIQLSKWLKEYWHHGFPSWKNSISYCKNQYRSFKDPLMDLVNLSSLNFCKHCLVLHMCTQICFYWKMTRLSTGKEINTCILDSIKTELIVNTNQSDYKCGYWKPLQKTNCGGYWLLQLDVPGRPLESNFWRLLPWLVSQVSSTDLTGIPRYRLCRVVWFQ